jgi:drug/metabolite transporter (DMT)-like permease
MDHLNKQERIGAGLAAGSVLLVGGSVAASSLLGGYPVLGGQGIRYLVAGLLLAVGARLRRKPLPRPVGREWAWLAGLAVIGLAGCSVLLIEATRVADPASVGVVIGATPMVIVIVAAVAAGTRPTRRVLFAAAAVTAGSAAAQLGGAAGTAWSGTGLLLSAGALGGAAGTSLLAAPVLPRLGALAVTIYSCGLAGILLLAAAVVASSAAGPPILRIPTASQLAALSYLTVAVTAVVFLAWYAAIKRLGVDRAGLFNGLIPITSLAAVALTGTGTITPLQFLAALTVLAGVIHGLGRTRQNPAGGHSGAYQAAGDPDCGPEPVQAGDEVGGGGLQGLVGHRVERVENEQRRGGVLAQLGAAGLAPVPAPAGHPGGIAPDHLAGLGVLGHREAVGRGVERLVASGAEQPRRAGVAGQVLSAQRDLVQHRDRVVVVGEPVHAGQPRFRPAQQRLQAVTGAFRLGSEGPVGLPPRRHVRELLGRAAVQRLAGCGLCRL